MFEDEVAETIRRGLRDEQFITRDRAELALRSEEFGRPICGFEAYVKSSPSMQVMIFTDTPLVSVIGDNVVRMALSDIVDVSLPRPADLPEVVFWGRGFVMRDRAIVRGDAASLTSFLCIRRDGLRRIYFWLTLLRVIRQHVKTPLPNERLISEDNF